MLCSTPFSMSFMNFYSLHMLHDRRQSTKTSAECHTSSLIGYGGGILDDIFQYLHLYEVLRREISEVRAFFAGTRGDLRAARDRARHPMRSNKCSIIFFSQLCAACVYFLNMYFFVMSLFFPFFTFHILKVLSSSLGKPSLGSPGVSHHRTWCQGKM